MTKVLFSSLFIDIKLRQAWKARTTSQYLGCAHGLHSHMLEQSLKEMLGDVVVAFLSISNKVLVSPWRGTLVVKHTLQIILEMLDGQKAKFVGWSHMHINVIFIEKLLLAESNGAGHYCFGIMGFPDEDVVTMMMQEWVEHSVSSTLVASFSDICHSHLCHCLWSIEFHPPSFPS